MNSKKDPLFQLIKSLTKSEKRQFKLYASRLEASANSNFIKLFEMLEKSNQCSEKTILEKTNIKKQQLSNSKANLYRQILVSLRLNPAHQNTTIRIRELLDHSNILYHKGLYKQSLKILEKAKNKALEKEKYTLAYQALEIQKQIESQYKTNSRYDRATSLVTSAQKIAKKNRTQNALCDLSLYLYDWFLKKGYVRSEEEYEATQNFYKDHLPQYDFDGLTFLGKFYLFKSKLWLAFICQDFSNCYRFAQKSLSLFEAAENMKSEYPFFYLKGINALLESLFYLKDKARFQAVYQKFYEDFCNGNFDKNENKKSLSSIYICLHKMNGFFLTGDFEKGVEEIPNTLEVIKALDNQIDHTQQMIFYYKIACMYFGVSNYESCIFYLNKIISRKKETVKQDVICYAYILNLVAHYESGNDFYIEKLIKGTYKYLISIDQLQDVQKNLIGFLRKLTDLYPSELKKEFKKLYEELLVFKDHPYEKRAFLYLDILSWLESHIKNIPISRVIKQANTHS